MGDVKLKMGASELNFWMMPYIELEILCQFHLGRYLKWLIGG